MNEWNKVDIKIPNITSSSYSAFKKSLLSSIQSLHFDAFRVYNLVGLQFADKTLLQVVLSHLNEHKFKGRVTQII